MAIKRIKRMRNKQYLYPVIAILSLFVSAISYAEDEQLKEDSVSPISFYSTAPITVKADRLNITNQGENNRNAVYSGNVLVEQAGLVIKADQLTMLSEQAKIIFLKAEGKPVYLENADKKNNLKAQANTIVYEIRNGWLEFSGGAPEVFYNNNQVKADFIRYNLKSKDLKAKGGQDRRVFLLIDPTSQ